MPLYDYRCASCGHRFEARQGFNDEPTAVCPACGDKSERLITAVAVIFKGSGFYKTDYKSRNGRTPADGNGTSPDSKGESKAEPKPATKTEEKSEAASSSTSSTAKESSTGSTGSKAKETAAKSDK